MSKNPVTMAEVIDRLFTRLSATYGADWTRQWASVPISDVKTAWGHELAGFIHDLPAIAQALENLPERCPNVIQFKALCKANRTVKTTLLLPEPKSDPVFIAKVLSKLAEPAPKTDGREWARRIIQRKADGEFINPFSLNLAKGALL
ncbi:MAG: hypothetical protein JWR74_3211 [Polaromonas sp.]|nr:hypothetical protein [Polaromonas sp.]